LLVQIGLQQHAVLLRKEHVNKDVAGGIYNHKEVVVSDHGAVDLVLIIAEILLEFAGD
jgi:hypothetical protein